MPFKPPPNAGKKKKAHKFKPLVLDEQRDAGSASHAASSSATHASSSVSNDASHSELKETISTHLTQDLLQAADNNVHRAFALCVRN